MGDRLAIVFVIRPVGVDERIETDDTIQPLLHGLKPERDAIICECKLDLTKLWRAAEIARRIDPQAIEHRKRPGNLNLCPWLVREEMREPEHHTKTEVLVD